MKRRDILKNIGLGTAGVMVSGETIAQTKPKVTPKKEIPEAENGRLRDEIIRDNKLKAQKFFTAQPVPPRSGHGDHRTGKARGHRFV